MRHAWMGVAVAVALAASGCTAIFGLDPVPSVDRDNDNVADDIDNCPDDANPDQSDFDHNGKGDACDLCTDGGDQDVDHDGIADGCDGCIGNGMDLDSDGIDDACDACIGNGMDVDHDHIDDACDSCIGNGVDADHDGIDDVCDTCIQTFVDIDGDGLDDGKGCDPCVASPPGQDADGDGIENACDVCPSGPQHDEDGDGKFDSCDTCAAINDVQQQDDDMDGVGDRCDIDDVGPNQEIFDSFAAQNPRWFIDGAGWIVGNDVLHLHTNLTSARWLDQMSGHFKISTKVAFQIFGPTGFGNVEVVAYDDTSLSTPRAIVCRVDQSGRVSVLTQLTSGTNVVFANQGVNPIATLELSLTVDDTAKQVDCAAHDTALPASTKTTATASIDELGVTWWAGLTGSHIDGDFSYFDEIRVHP